MLSVTNDAHIPVKLCALCFDNARVMVLIEPKNYTISKLTGSAKYMGQIK